MRNFIARHAEKITGVLSGFDRILFRGHLSSLCHVEGVKNMLFTRQGVLLKEAGAFFRMVTLLMRQAAADVARRLNRPSQYLESSSVSKEDLARRYLESHPTKAGLICQLSAQENSWTWEVHRSREKRMLELHRRSTKCVHIYSYFIDPDFGPMHVRLQTWIPYTIQVCMNGREWLARQLEREGIGFEKLDNYFAAIDDVDAAQNIMSRMAHLRWTKILDNFALVANPMLAEIFKAAHGSYYWAQHQSEWATDVMFRRPEDLAELYPRLVRHAISSMGSEDTMRFLGKKLSPIYKGEVITTFRKRAEGICVRHRARSNSEKMYDKFGRGLRVENTTNQPGEHKIRRRAHGDLKSAKKLRPMRKGLADLPARAALGQACNARYLDALAAADLDQTVADVVNDVLVPAWHGNRRTRALQPWSHPDIDVLRAIGRGEFIANGFRSKDLLPLIYTPPAADQQERRKQLNRLSRLLRIFRAHGLLRKVEGTHRHHVTEKGRAIIAAVILTSEASVAKLARCA